MVNVIYTYMYDDDDDDDTYMYVCIYVCRVWPGTIQVSRS